MNDSPDSDLLDCTLPEENLSPINSNSISDHEVKEVTKCQQRYFSLLVDLWGAGEKLQGPTENSTRHTHSPTPNISLVKQNPFMHLRKHTHTGTQAAAGGLLAHTGLSARLQESGMQRGLVTLI